MVNVMSDTATAKNKNRRLRQEALREQLSQQGHEQHITDMVNKLMNEAVEVEPPMVKRFEVAISTKLKLMNKYIPDLKQSELEVTGKDGEKLDNIFNVNIVKPSA